MDWIVPSIAATNVLLTLWMFFRNTGKQDAKAHADELKEFERLLTEKLHFKIMDAVHHRCSKTEFHAFEEYVRRHIDDVNKRWRR